MLVPLKRANIKFKYQITILKKCNCVGGIFVQCTLLNVSLTGPLGPQVMGQIGSVCIKVAFMDQAKVELLGVS